MDEGNQRSHFWAVTMCHGIGSLAVFSINGCYARTCYIRIMPVFVCHSDDIPFSVLQNSYRRCRSTDFWMIYAPSQEAFLKFRIAAWGQTRRKRVHARIPRLRAPYRSLKGGSEWRFWLSTYSKTSGYTSVLRSHRPRASSSRSDRALPGCKAVHTILASQRWGNFPAFRQLLKFLDFPYRVTYFLLRR